MNTRFRIVVGMLCLAALASSNGVFANGINPPRLKESTTITASCQARSGTRKHEIMRARITVADKSADTLTIRIDDTTEQLAISEIESIHLSDGAVDRSGFARATLVRRGESKEETAAVQVRAKNAKFKLSGFGSAGSGISIEIAKCRKIEFSTLAKDESDQPRRPALAN